MTKTKLDVALDRFDLAVQEWAWAGGDTKDQVREERAVERTDACEAVNVVVRQMMLEAIRCGIQVHEAQGYSFQGQRVVEGGKPAEDIVSGIIKIIPQNRL